MSCNKTKQQKSRIYDTAFVSEGRNISLETLDLDGATSQFINETLETADRLFDGDGNAIDMANRPMMKIKIPFDRPIKPGSMLRMKSE